jgi:general secretion pathway protein D
LSASSIACAALLLVSALLVACAGAPQSPDGARLIAAGHYEEGLAAFESSARAAPRNQSLRFEFLRRRESVVSRLIAQAQTALAAEDYAKAEAAYRRALAIAPDDARAAAGLTDLYAAQRHAAELMAAEAALTKGDLATAEEKLRAVLAQDALHRGARLLLRRVTDARAGAALARPRLKTGAGKRVTLEFRDANIRAVFDALARTTGVNFVFDKDVRPDIRTTIVVRETTLEDVIKLILATNQLDHKVLNDNTVLVYPNTAAKQREYQDLVVRSFYLANTDAKQAMNLVRTVLKTRDIYVDEKLNLLVMRDTAEAVRLAERLIAAQDLAEPEVTLEVEVLEVASSQLQELGVRPPSQILFQDPSTVPAPGATGTGTLQRLSGGLVGFVATPAFIVNLRSEDGTTNVLANPRIRVKNKEKARVHIGDRVPVVTTTATANVGVSASVTYLDVGLKLEVEPSIHLEGDVAIRVGLEVSNIVREVPVSGGGLAYQLGTRNAATTLRLRDGETQVLAGLIQDDERSVSNGVPGLARLPVLGRLFSSKLDNRLKTEIVLLITPRVVRTLVRPEHAVAEFYSGTENAAGAARLTISPTPDGAVSVSGRPSAQGTDNENESPRRTQETVTRPAPSIQPGPIPNQPAQELPR